jgi:hypothetical protein
MRPDHDQFERVGIGHAVGQKVLRGVHLELVHEDAVKFPAFLLSDGGGLSDLPNLLVQNFLLLLLKASDSLLKRTRLDDFHDKSSKHVLGGLALIQFLDPDHDVLDQSVRQVRVLLGTLPDTRPVFDLARYRAVINGAE